MGILRSAQFAAQYGAEAVPKLDVHHREGGTGKVDGGQCLGRRREWPQHAVARPHQSVAEVFRYEEIRFG